MNKKDKRLKRKINSIKNMLWIISSILLFLSIWIDGYHTKLFLTSIFMYGLTSIFVYMDINFDKLNNGDKR